MEATETTDRIPLWLAVAITVCVSLPFGIWLGAWSLPIWVSFIVWAEYFALGAKATALMTMIPAFILGVVVAEIIMTAWVWLSDVFTEGNLFTIGSWTATYGDLALFITCFIGFCIFIFGMKYVPVTQTGSLPYFNGISMGLGVYFTGAFAPFANVDPLLVPTVAGLGAILAGVLGAILGWFNVTITFPHPVQKRPTATGHQPVGA